MRLFLMNAGIAFENAEIAKRTKVKKELVRKEVSILKNAGFIKKKTKGWFLNSAFPKLDLLRVFLVGSDIIQKKELADRFKAAGKVKFLAVSGIFIQANESRVDLLIVGDNLKKDKIESIISDIESNIGKELAYAFFETDEFRYRLSMYDKLIHDILDYPHEVVISFGPNITAKK